MDGCDISRRRRRRFGLIEVVDCDKHTFCRTHAHEFGSTALILIITTTNWRFLIDVIFSARFVSGITRPGQGPTSTMLSRPRWG